MCWSWGAEMGLGGGGWEVTAAGQEGTMGRGAAGASQLHQALSSTVDAKCSRLLR